jgi:hypothetical protein
MPPEIQADTDILDAVVNQLTDGQDALIAGWGRRLRAGSAADGGAAAGLPENPEETQPSRRRRDRQQRAGTVEDMSTNEKGR